MGEIANDYIYGKCCYHCMHYFDEAQDVPALCEDCWNEASKKEKKNFVKVSTGNSKIK